VKTRYEVFCAVDPFFYDSPTAGADHSLSYAAGLPSLPAGWERAETGDWLACHPRNVRLPLQGWKIHVSACLSNAAEILSSVWDYCVARNVAFKFLRNETLLLLQNAKSADRGASGKFITIYPVDEAQLATTLHDLGRTLTGRPGPYILSDLRVGSGPLFVRYGGFALRWHVTANGERVPAIEDTSGRLVPDLRVPRFEIPSWVILPECLRPHLEARNIKSDKDLRYDFLRALHFSNAGGVYEGVERSSGARVLIKEARPYAGLSVDGRDAVERLQHERDVLARLADLPDVPPLRDYFMWDDHHFLVQEFVAGPTLNTMFIDRYPLTRPNFDAATATEYAAWAMQISGHVEHAVAAVHARGVHINDIQPSNVLVRPDGSIALVDWEIATFEGDDKPASLATPGYLPPRGVTGRNADRYALACMRLALFMPLTAMLRLDPGKAEQFGVEIQNLFPSASGFVSEAVEVIRAADASSRPRNAAAASRPTIEPTPKSWSSMRASMARAILSSATPDRDDRLFPGGIEQFDSGGGLNIAHGAAGVLFALHATGAGQPPHLEDWLIRHARQAAAQMPLGFYDGLHGVAYVLHELGHAEAARDLLDTGLARDPDHAIERGDLYGGLAGIGLNLAHFATVTGDSSLRRHALTIAARLADRLAREEAADDAPNTYRSAGLMHGWSGPALLFVRLHEMTGDAGLLDRAKSALDRDLLRCIPGRDGALYVDEGYRAMPYLEHGSVGIGMVLAQYLAHRPDKRLQEAAAAIRPAAESQFYVQAGLFNGLAGMIHYLSQIPAGNPDVVGAQMRRLSRFAVSYADRIAFAGDQLLRLSMALATGTAGVMVALGAVLHKSPVNLPFLTPWCASDGAPKAQSGG